MTDFTTLSGNPVPRVAYGCMQWGGNADQAAARAMFDACRDAGIVHFDTAHGYNDGRSEDMLGQIAAPIRDDLFIATKVAYAPGRAARDVLMADFDLSRKRLGLDVVDLLYLHRFDPETELDETYSALAELQERGLIRHIGVSNYAAWQVMKAQGVAAGFGTRIDAIQPMYNLVKRQAEVEILPMARDQDITVCSYSPLGGGLLTGKYAGGAGAGRIVTDKMYAARYGNDWMHAAASGLADIAQGADTDPATLAVAWIRRQVPDICPILSARSVEQLQPSLAGLTLDLPGALFDRITALGRTPPPATDRTEET